MQAQHAAAPRDCLEVRGRSDRSCEASVSLELDWQPERFALSTPLAELLGVQYETKARAMQVGGV